MKETARKFVPGLAVALAFWLGFALGTRHGRAEAISIGDLRHYFELGKDLGETIKQIDANVTELQQHSDHLKGIKAALTGEKPPKSAPAK